MISFICLLIAFAEAGTIDLGNDITFEWSFPDDSSVSFVYTYPKTMKDDYNWSGIYYKPKGSEVATDGWLATEKHVIYDSYSATGSLVPDSDENQGGTEDIVSSFGVSVGEEFKVDSWTRAFDTGDGFDIVFAKDQMLEFTFVHGYFDENENLVDPAKDGLVNQADITLTDESESFMFLSIL